MPYRDRIKQISADFPGILERVDVLNSQLKDLADKGFKKLVENFLSNLNVYTLRPFLFEIFTYRWILSFGCATDIEYEPNDITSPPDFRFKIDDKLFNVQVKTLMQVQNETIKKKIVMQINRRISSLTSNVIEIWLSDNIEQKVLNDVVEWISSKAIELRKGEKDSFMNDDDCYAWVRILDVSKGEGHIGIQHIGGTHDGLLSEINNNRIREQFRQKISQANKQFPLSDDCIFNFIVMTYDFDMLLSFHTLQSILYGAEGIFDHCDQAQNWHLYEKLKDNGIWSKRVFTKTDILFVFESGIDMLENIFEPYVFVNPHNSPKVRTIPEPFKSMQCHIPSLYFSGPRKID